VSTPCSETVNSKFVSPISEVNSAALRSVFISFVFRYSGTPIYSQAFLVLTWVSSILNIETFLGFAKPSSSIFIFSAFISSLRILWLYAIKRIPLSVFVAINSTFALILSKVTYNRSVSSL